jgi:hypothetical protein
VYPSACAHADDRGKLPLHLAAQHNGTEAIITAMLKHNPAAVKEKDRANNLPLHWAAEGKTAAAGVKAMLALDPPVKVAPGSVTVKGKRAEVDMGSVGAKDALSMLPLHRAAITAAPLSSPPLTQCAKNDQPPQNGAALVVTTPLSAANAAAAALRAFTASAVSCISLLCGLSGSVAAARATADALMASLVEALLIVEEEVCSMLFLCCAP